MWVQRWARVLLALVGVLSLTRVATRFSLVAVPDLVYLAPLAVVLWLSANWLFGGHAPFAAAAVAAVVFVFGQVLDSAQVNWIPLNWASVEPVKFAFYVAALVPVMLAAVVLVRRVIDEHSREASDVIVLAATGLVGLSWVSAYLLGRLVVPFPVIVTGRVVGESVVAAVFEVFPVVVLSFGLVAVAHRLLGMANKRIKQTRRQVG